MEISSQMAMGIIPRSSSAAMILTRKQRRLTIQKIVKAVQCQSFLRMIMDMQ